MAISRLGQAEVAYRQGVGPGSPLPGPRIFLNTLPDGESRSAAPSSPARASPTRTSPAAPLRRVGPPSIDIDEKQDMRLLYDANGTPRVIEGNDRGLTGTLSLGPPFAGTEPSAASVMNPAGGGVSAWPSADAQGDPAVAVREDFPDGAVQTALVSGGAGGEIGELAVGRSGLGDGLVAFRQGPLGNAAIVAAQATAPPDGLLIDAPKGWVKPSQAVVSWLPADQRRRAAELPGRARRPAAADARRRLAGAPGPARPGLRAPPRAGAGHRHRRPGHALASLHTEVDGAPPTVRIQRTGRHAVSVRVSDAYSGVDTHAVSVSFGDGSRAGGRASLRHRYARGGVYQIVVHVRDKLGNTGVVRRLVSVR